MTKETTPGRDVQAKPTTDQVEPLSLALTFRILKEGRLLIALTGAALLVIAILVAFLSPTVYTATASFIPPGANTSSGAAALMGQLSSLGAGSLLGGKTQGDLYLAFLKSQTIRRMLVQRFDLQHVYRVKKESSAEASLTKKSTFELDPKSSIVTIAVEDESPQRARNLTEGYLRALEETTGNLALGESSQRRSFYERRLAQERDQLADAEIALKQNQEKTGLVAPAGQTALQIQTLANLRAQVSGRKVQLASLSYNESDENPEMIRLRKEIATLDEQVSKLESGQNKESYGRFSNAQVPELQLEYIRLFREVQYHLTLFEIISKQYEAARLDEAKDSFIQILDHAVVPDVPTGPRRKLIIAAGLLAGLLIGSTWVLIRSASWSGL